MASNQQAGSSHLLSPNVIPPPGGQEHHQQQRRKSTLSGNGFFIDYSCTRRRSSAARQTTGPAGYLSPVAAGGRARAGGGGSFCAGSSQPSSPGGGGRSRAHSRAGTTISAATTDPMSRRRLASTSMLLVPPLYAPSALAGSRKTSIFDPAGHSLNAAHLRTMRRKSTMVTSQPLASAALDFEPLADQSAADATTSKMLALAKTMAARSSGVSTAAGSPAGGGGGGGARPGSSGGHRMAQVGGGLVPVIGCSPTSIRASLAALDETRRYEKLLKKLKRHEKQRQKKRAKKLLADSQAQDDAPSHLSFRRKSLRAIKDATQLLRASGRKHRRGDEVENLSVSSMSLSHAFDQSSSSSSCSAGSRRTSVGSRDEEDDSPLDEESQDDDDERYELNNDELFLDDDTLVNFNEPAAGAEEPATTESNTEAASRTNGSPATNLVKFAMRRLTGSTKRLSAVHRRRAAQKRRSHHHQQPTTPTATTTSEASGAERNNADYWHYYYYLRENSLDAIDDLPISGLGASGNYGATDGGCGGGSNLASGVLGEAERRIRLHMNYSLARVQILNDASQWSSSSARRVRLGQDEDDDKSQAAIISSSRSENEQRANLFDGASQVSLSLSTTSAESADDARQPAASGQTGSGSSLDQEQDQEQESTIGSTSSESEPTTTSGPCDMEESSVSLAAAAASRSSLNVRGNNSIEWRQSMSMSSQSVALAYQPSQVGQQVGQPRQQQQQQRRDNSEAQQRGIRRRGQEMKQRDGCSGVGGNLADDECTSVECLMDRNRLSPSPMRPQSADTSSRHSATATSTPSAAAAAVSRKHRSASGELLADAAAKQQHQQQQQRRSASFRSHNHHRRRAEQQQQQQQLPVSGDKPAAAADVVVDELDDFERFRRAHRPGYNENGDRQQPEWELADARKPPSGRDRRDRPASTHQARGSSSCNLRAAASRTKAGRDPIGTSSMSWDSLNSDWPNNVAANTRQQRHRREEQPAVKRTSSARISSGRHREPTQINSYSNPTARFTAASADQQPATNFHFVCSRATTTTTTACNQRQRNTNNYDVPSSYLQSTGGDSRLLRAGPASEVISAAEGGIVNLAAGIGPPDDGRSSWQTQQQQQRLVVVSCPPVHVQPSRSGSLRLRQEQQQRQLFNEVGQQQRQDAATPTSNAETGAHRVRAHSTGASTSGVAASTCYQLRGGCGGGSHDGKGNQFSGERLEEKNIDYHSEHDPSATQRRRRRRRRRSNNNKQQKNNDNKTLERDFQLLAKNSFTCLIIGARQTGKRTIVKCFVKLVNEFRLAVDEYRKEKILTKLMDCRERLQMLARQQAEQREQREAERQLLADSLAGRRRSRVNSWLGGKLLTHLPAGSKLRLHSLVPTSAGVATPSLLTAPQHNVRRHTAIEPASEFNLCGGGGRGSGTGPGRERGASIAPISRDGIGRHSTKERRRPVEFLTASQAAGRLNCCNKSDFNINYLTETDSPQSAEHKRDLLPDPPGREYIVMSQLQVPISSTSGQQQLQSRSLTTSTSSLCSKMPRTAPNKPLAATSSQALGSGGGCSHQAATRISINTNAADIEGSDRQRRRSSTKGQIRRQHHQHRKRRDQLQRTNVSLKEINRRRIRVKFSTRRQLSDKYFLSDSSLVNKHEAEEGESDDSGTMDTAPVVPSLPDSVMVVYSVNDRDSFEYAKSLISQLKSLREKRDLLLPIILVANKIDLERAKVVKPEEGRALARRNECKYMEISCTVGFKLDNLLVGLRTQLVLKHHTTLNAILKGKPQQPGAEGPLSESNQQTTTTAPKSKSSNTGGGGNILVRFYKRYVMDDHEHDYDCDNFSRL